MRTDDDDEIGSPLLQDHFSSTDRLEVGSDGGDYGTATTPLYESDCATPGSDVQEGVRQIEAVSRAWTKSALIVAYMRFVTSNQVVYPRNWDEERVLTCLPSKHLSHRFHNVTGGTGHICSDGFRC